MGGGSPIGALLAAAGAASGDQAAPRRQRLQRPVCGRTVICHFGRHFGERDFKQQTFGRLKGEHERDPSGNVPLGGVPESPIGLWGPDEIAHLVCNSIHRSQSCSNFKAVPIPKVVPIPKLFQSQTSNQICIQDMKISIFEVTHPLCLFLLD